MFFRNVYKVPILLGRWCLKDTNYIEKESTRKLLRNFNKDIHLDVYRFHLNMPRKITKNNVQNSESNHSLSATLSFNMYTALIPFLYVYSIHKQLSIPEIITLLL